VLLLLPKLQHLHRAHRDANAALDTRGVFVRELLLVFGELHDVDADLAVARAFAAINALHDPEKKRLPAPCLLYCTAFAIFLVNSFGAETMPNHYQKLLDRLAELGFSDSHIGALTYSSERTVQNWRRRRSSPSPLIVQQLERVIGIVEDLRKLVNPVAFNDWFFQPNQLLGKSPYKAIIDGDYKKLQKLTITLAEGPFA
jgi:hypothetical protein